MFGECFMGNFQVSVVPKSDGCFASENDNLNSSLSRRHPFLDHHHPFGSGPWSKIAHWKLQTYTTYKRSPPCCTMSGKNKCGFMWLYSYISLRSYSFKVGRQRTRGKVLVAAWNTTCIKIDMSTLNTLRVWALAIISMWDVHIVQQWFVFLAS